MTSGALYCSASRRECLDSSSLSVSMNSEEQRPHTVFAESPESKDSWTTPTEIPIKENEGLNATDEETQRDSPCLSEASVRDEGQPSNGLKIFKEQKQHSRNEDIVPSSGAKQDDVCESRREAETQLGRDADCTRDTVTDEGKGGGDNPEEEEGSGIAEKSEKGSEKSDDMGVEDKTISVVRSWDDEEGVSIDRRPVIVPRHVDADRAVIGGTSLSSGTAEVDDTSNTAEGGQVMTAETPPDADSNNDIVVIADRREAVAEGTSVEAIDADDDFGEFEEGEVASTQNDFGFRFEQASTKDASLERRSGVDRTPSHGNHLMELTGLDYRNAVSWTLLQTSNRRPPEGLRQGADVSELPAGPGKESERHRDTKLYVSSRSRLGVHLLHCRSMPRGFLRSVGIPVVLSSQMTSIEQRLLRQLGLQEAFTMTQREEAASRLTTPEPASPMSRTSSPFRKAGSVCPSITSDLNLDLDFLVQLSSQQMSGSGGSSARGEETGRPSQLHELFDGLLESSQSSFVSISSEGRRERDSTPSQELKKDVVFNEEDWDVFVDAQEQPSITEKPLPVEKVQSASQSASPSVQSSPAVPPSKEPLPQNDDIHKDLPDSTPVTVDGLIDGQDVQPVEEEKDIFSGEWLEQLRASHESSEVPCTIEASPQVEAEWGSFAEAPCPRSVREDDVFGMLVPDIRSSSLEQKSEKDVYGKQKNENGFVDPLAIFARSSIVPSDEDEWGGFQG